MERRRERRRRVTLQVDYPDRQGYRVDWTESISPGGVFIRTNRHHRVGERLRIKMSLPGFVEQIELTGEVAWVRHETPTEAAGIGFRVADEEFFDRVSPLLPLAASRDFSLASGPYARLAALPRVRLGTIPTPLRRAERLTRSLGGPEIWIKRDDLTGFADGGSIVRKLELIAGDAVDSGADTLVTIFNPQRPHQLRAIAAVAGHLGMATVVLLPGGTQPDALQSCLELFPDIGVIPVPKRSGPALERAVAAALARMTGDGNRPYLVPQAQASWLGSCGYVLASIELASQFRRLDIDPIAVVCAVESGATQSGLVVGQRWLDAAYDIMGVTGETHADRRRADIATGAVDVDVNLNIDDTLPVDDIWLVNDIARADDRQRVIAEAVRLVADTEGVFLDSDHNGMAMAELVAHIRRGEFDKTQSVVFLHTGSLPPAVAPST